MSKQLQTNNMSANYAKILPVQINVQKLSYICVLLDYS